MQQTIKVWLFLLFSFCGLWGISHGYKELMIEERGGRPIRVIKVVLDGEHFVVASPAGLGGETTEALAQKVGGDTAINAAFFCPDDYSNCKINGKRTTHTISERVFMWDGASWSSFWGDTSIRMIFSFDKEGNPFFVQKNSGMHDEGLWSNTNQDRLNDIYFGIGNFPVLLLEGEDVVQAYSKYIDSKMRGSANRNFICSTQDGNTIYMGVIGASSILNLPKYLKTQLWCRNALSLDAGASTAMVYEGKTLDRSSRTRVMDAFVVLNREEYQKLTGLSPAPKSITKIQGYQNYIPTEEDQTKLDAVKAAIEAVYQKYGKSKYKPIFIKMLRSTIANEQVVAKKWLYNQVLIYLFTIDSFSTV